MFPALRQNGIARWLALLLALFTVPAVLLLGLALELKSPRSLASGPRADVAAKAEVEPLHAKRAAPAAARREPARK